MLCSLQVPLKSHYFDIGSSRSVNTFSKSSNFSAYRNKRESLEVRLNYEYKWCLLNHGQVYFYTLTFNDYALPYFMGRACHDYNIIREFIHGGFEKKLSRTFNYKLRYFISAECGEGGASHNFPGSRGKGHNPHYHVIFFLYPLVKDNSKSLLNPYSFCNLVREYWQGKQCMNYDTPQSCKSKLCKYGYACPGTDLGVVSNSCALRYVAKYVNKEDSEIEFEDKIFSESLRSYKFSDLSESYKEFLHDHNLVCDVSKLSQRLINKGLLTLSELYEERIKRCGYYDEWQGYVENKAYDYAKGIVQLFRTRYSSKCRYSHGLGWELGNVDLEKNLLDPHLYCDTKNQVNKEKPVSLYYLRKKYYSRELDQNGNNVYVLNALGRKMLLFKFQNNYKDSVRKVSETIKFFHDNLNLVRDLSFKYESLGEFVDANNIIINLKKLSNFESYPGSVFDRYYLYKRIYQFRYTSNLNCSISPSDDLFKFLHPCFYYSQYNEELLNVHKVFQNIHKYEKYYSYDLHPFFSSYIDLFRIFDYLVDYKNYLHDRKDKADFQRNEKVSKFHINKRFNNI